MKRGLISACAALLVGSGWVMAQGPLPPGSSALPGTFVPGPTTGIAAPSGGPGFSAPVGPVGLADAPAVPLPSAQEPPYTYWATAEYLLWRIADPRLPSSASSMPGGLLAVTTSTTSLPPPPAPFFQTTLLPIGTSGTGSPGGIANMGEHQGTRLTVGMWLDPATEDNGFEVSMFMLENRTFDFSTVFSNPGNVNGAFAINTGLSSVVVVTTTTGPAASPTVTTQTFTNPVILAGTSAGNLSGFLRDQMLGGELNYRSTCSYFGPVKFGILAGARYLFVGEDYQLNDAYTVSLTKSSGAALIVPGLPTTLPVATYDRILAHNNIFGAQGGVDAEANLGAFYFDAQFKLLLGVNAQNVNINALSFTPTGVSFGGSNYGAGDVGDHLRTRMTEMPEVQLKIGYNFNDNLRCWIGYDGMYIYNVVRTAGQTEAATTPLQVQVGPTSTTATVNAFSFHFNDSVLPIQGLNLGLEIRY